MHIEYLFVIFVNYIFYIILDIYVIFTIIYSYIIILGKGGSRLKILDEKKKS